MSLNRIGIPSDIIDAARRCHLQISTEKDREILRQAACKPLLGGFNNGVYRIEYQGNNYCLKFYKVDGKQRALREWTALHFLIHRDFGYVPTPFYYEENARAPLVIIEFIDGVPLGNHHLNKDQLSVLVERVKELQSISHDPRVETLGIADGQKRLDGMTSFMGTVEPVCREEQKCLELWEEWTRGKGADMVCIPAPLVFSRMDTNLSNCLWDGCDLRFVDLEYGGWTDRVFDLAEQVEHDQSRGTPDEKWSFFINQFDLTSWEHERFFAAQCLMAFFWARLFWPKSGGDISPKFISRVERIEKLLKRPFSINLAFGKGCSQQ